MDARLRLTFFCGSCLGLAVGFAVGHVSVWRKFDTSRTLGVSLNDSRFSSYSASMGTAGFDGPPVIPELDVESRMPAPGGAVVLNDPDLGDEPVHADATVEMPNSVAEALDSPFPSDRSPPPPQPLPTSSAKPLSPVKASTPLNSFPKLFATQQAQAVSSDLEPLDPEVAEMLKDELQGVTEQHREIWADALRGMSPGDAAGVILMWKKFGQKGVGVGHLSSPPPSFEASHPGRVPEPLDGPPQLRSLLPTPTIREDLATQMTLHNQSNRETCGYLEMVPLLREVAFDQASGDEHVQIAGYRLNIKPGRLLETGNPAHVAVQRECFFAVTLPTGEEQYTRVGRLVLDAERRVCIDLGDRDLPIAPEVKLPEGATRFTVQNGQLRVSVDGQAEPIDVGPLQVAEFFDASRLQPMGSSLYAATTASGKPKRVAAELIFQTLEYPLIEGQILSAEATPIKPAPVAAARRE